MMDDPEFADDALYGSSSDGEEVGAQLAPLHHLPIEVQRQASPAAP